MKIDLHIYSIPGVDSFWDLPNASPMFSVQPLKQNGPNRSTLFL